MSTFSFSIFGKVLSFDSSKSIIKSYPVKTACENLGHKDVFLSSMINTLNFECMGTKVKSDGFCLKMKKDARGFPFLKSIVTKDNEVICHYGKSAILTIECDERDKNKFCRHSKRGCVKLKKIFAQELELHHHAITGSNDFNNRLSCFFTSNDQKFKTENQKSLNFDKL